MIVEMLINAAFTSGAIRIEDAGRDMRLVTTKLGATVVLSKLSKESIYQMAKHPGDPATLAEAQQRAESRAIAETQPVASPEPEKVLADEPVPLPVPKRQKPQLTLIQGGVQ